jgi:hypothetical protein
MVEMNSLYRLLHSRVTWPAITITPVKEKFVLDYLRDSVYRRNRKIATKVAQNLVVSK